MNELDIKKVNIDSQVDMLITVYDSVFDGKVGNYVSTPITSGKRLFDFLVANQVRDRDALIEKIGSDAAKKNMDNIKEENSKCGEEFAASLRKGNLPNVVNPTKFEAIHFGQDHYNHFWTILIDKKIRAVYFNQDWEYSQGCTIEYLATVRHRVPAYDHLGAPLTTPVAIARMSEALRRLADQGFSETNYSGLSSKLAQLQELSKANK